MEEKLPNPPKNPIKKSVEKISRTKDYVAKRHLLDQIFQDCYDNRRKLYRVNFFRGIFFGFGVAIGGTLLVALTIGLLSALVYYLPAFSDFFYWLIETLQR